MVIIVCLHCGYFFVVATTIVPVDKCERCGKNPYHVRGYYPSPLEKPETHVANNKHGQYFRAGYRWCSRCDIWYSPEQKDFVCRTCRKMLRSTVRTQNRYDRVKRWKERNPGKKAEYFKKYKQAIYEKAKEEKRKNLLFLFF